MLHKWTPTLVTTRLFWLAIVGFLSWTLPHTASTFRHFEPNDSLNVVWWAVSIIIAVSLDGLACWLAWTAVTAKEKGDGSVIWTFIVLIVILSSVCNWIFGQTIIYGEHFWKWVVFSTFTVEDLFSVVVGCIPVFLIAYTVIAKHILGEVKVVTASDLKAKNDEREDLLSEQKRARGIGRAEFRDNARGFFGRMGDVVDAAKSLGKTEDTTDEPYQNTDVSQEDTPEKDLLKGTTQPLIPSQLEEEQENPPTTDQELPTIVKVPGDKTMLFINGKRYYTLNRAAAQWKTPRSAIENKLNSLPQVQEKYCMIVPQGKTDVLYVSEEAKRYLAMTTSSKRRILPPTSVPSHLSLVAQNQKEKAKPVETDTRTTDKEALV